MKRIAAFCLMFCFAAAAVAADQNGTAPALPTPFTQAIILPLSLQLVLQSLFSLPAGTILTLQSAIILTVLFTLVFVIVYSVAVLIPFLEGWVRGGIAALIITLLASVGGGMYQSMLFFSTASEALVKMFAATSSLGSTLTGLAGIALAVSIGILIIITMVLLMVLHAIRKILSKEEAHEAGWMVGANIAKTAAYSKIFKKSLED